MEISVYVANLAMYNEGELVGEWITLPADEEELQHALDEILGSDEEMAIHDYESFFPIHEYENVFTLNRKIQRLQRHDPNIVRCLFEHTGSLDETISVIEGGDYSCYLNVDSMEDVAYEMVEEGLFGTIPEALQSYIDYEKLGRDLEHEGWAVHNGIAIRIH